MLLPTRREFLHSLGAVALLPLKQTNPDLILYNGNVITIDSGQPGKLADLVVLEQDPTQVDPLSIVDIPIQRTMVGGRWVYEA